MAKGRILVVDDEADILEVLKYNLSREGYDVDTAATGEEGLKKLRRSTPNLIILDLMLPGLDGLEICKMLKDPSSKTAHIPVVMLTAKGEESDVVSGLEIGADDYIVKPFSPNVLLARIKSVMRRAKGAVPADEGGVMVRGDLVINEGRRELLVGGEKVDLTFSEFEILRHLAKRPGWVYTRNQIVSAVKGDDYPVTERAIDVQIVGLRKKLGAHGEIIETVRGVGYRFGD